MAMGYEAMALGGRDLDAPLATVRARFKEAGFPFLAASVQPSGAQDDGALPNVQPYLLRRMGRHTIAVVGASAGQPVVWSIDARIKEEPVNIQITGDRLAALAEDGRGDLATAVRAVFARHGLYQPVRALDLDDPAARDELESAWDKAKQAVGHAV